MCICGHLLVMLNFNITPRTFYADERLSPKICSLIALIHTLSKNITDLSGNITLQVPKNYKNKENLSIIGFIENGRLQISGATQIKV